MKMTIEQRQHDYDQIEYRKKKIKDGLAVFVPRIDPALVDSFEDIIGHIKALFKLEEKLRRR